MNRVICFYKLLFDKVSSFILKNYFHNYLLKNTSNLRFIFFFTDSPKILFYGKFHKITFSKYKNEQNTVIFLNAFKCR